MLDFARTLGGGGSNPSRPTNFPGERFHDTEINCNITHPIRLPDGLYRLGFGRRRTRRGLTPQPKKMECHLSRSTKSRKANRAETGKSSVQFGWVSRFCPSITLLLSPLVSVWAESRHKVTISSMYIRSTFRRENPHVAAD